MDTHRYPKTLYMIRKKQCHRVKLAFPDIQRAHKADSAKAVILEIDLDFLLHAHCTQCRTHIGTNTFFHASVDTYTVPAAGQNMTKLPMHNIFFDPAGTPSDCLSAIADIKG